MERENFSARNEWGKLRTAMIGTVDDLVMPSYISSMKWMTKWARDDLEKYAGQECSKVVPGPAV
ncbi:MAG TPA: hypothetical protein VN455_00960 [Methanotrichaceae archaeon]|nr:hypothetical protein [Methanotrichaceae archaeon]